MLQTASGRMILVVDLIILVCVLKQAESTTPACENIMNLYQKLEVAEQIIKSAKERIPADTQPPKPMDCEELLNSGEKNSDVYLVWPKNRVISGSISVYCDMETDGGGWTVIQRRGNFSRHMDYFYQGWQAYKDGFGNLKEDFWLGNDKIYALSNQKLYSARFDLGDAEGNKRYAMYDNFWIDSEENNYTLHSTRYSGNAGDALALHNGQQFSTKDRDNDIAHNSCSQSYKGAWWFRKCHDSNLNGEYLAGKHEKKGRGIIWHQWKGNTESLATIEIKIRKNPSWIQ